MFFNSKKSFLILALAIFFFSFSEKSNAYPDLVIYPGHFFGEEGESLYRYLMSAIKHGDEVVFDVLIKVGVKVNFNETIKRYTALHFAALFGGLYMIQRLLDQGADLYAKDIDGNTPLHWAAIREDPNNFEFLKYYYDNSFAMNDDFKSRHS